MKDKLKTYLLLTLCTICAILFIYAKIQSKLWQRDKDKIVYMDGNLNKVVEITNGLLIEKYRDKKGTVRIRRTFVPPESTVKIVTDRKEDGTDGQTTVKYSRLGYCFSMGISSGYYGSGQRRLEVGFSPKVIYFGRYGVIMDVSRYGAGAGISRYIDDLLILWHPRNLELYGSYTIVPFRNDANKVVVGIRITL